MSDLSNALKGLEALTKGPAPRTPLPSSPSRQPPAVRAVKGLPWTPEQEAILGSLHPRLDVVALAGTGKTAVLGEYARRRPNGKWRYLTFNRALANQAPDHLPSNTRASTFHALAFPRFGAPLEKKLGRRFDPQAVRRAVGWAEFPGWEVAVAALREWRKAFLASSHSLPSVSQLPTQTWAWLNAHPGVLTAVDGTHGLQRAIEAFWQATIDARQVGVDAPVDVAVKLMALGQAPWWADGLLIDEAQDMTPCLATAMEHQKIPVLAVGDPSQTLYAWRRAGSAWPSASERLALTGSFRFGEPVAEVANAMLEKLGQLERLRGLHPASALDVTDAPLKAGTTWIARTQAGAWQGVLSALEAGLKPGWIGKGTLGRLQATVDLALGRPVRDPWLAGVSSVEALRQVADTSGALEWKAAASLVLKQGPAAVEAALASLADPTQANVHITTVHQAKGQTFERARLGEDLRWDTQDPEEWRVNYVALSRSPCLEFSTVGWNAFVINRTPLAKKAVAPAWEGDDGF